MCLFSKYSYTDTNETFFDIINLRLGNIPSKIVMNKSATKYPFIISWLILQYINLFSVLFLYWYDTYTYIRISYMFDSISLARIHYISLISCAIIQTQSFTIFNRYFTLSIPSIFYTRKYLSIFYATKLEKEKFLTGDIGLWMRRWNIGKR